MFQQLATICIWVFPQPLIYQYKLITWTLMHAHPHFLWIYITYHRNHERVQEKLVAHESFEPGSQSINKFCVKDVFSKLCESLQNKIWCMMTLFLPLLCAGAAIARGYSRHGTNWQTNTTVWMTPRCMWWKSTVSRTPSSAPMSTGFEATPRKC